MQKVECVNCNSSPSVSRQNILFLGDSLTKRCDLEKCYKDFVCKNCGVSGDTLSRFVSSGVRPWSSDKIHVNEKCYKVVSALINSALKEENL